MKACQDCKRPIEFGLLCSKCGAARIDAEARRLFAETFPRIAWDKIYECERQSWRDDAENELYGEK